MKYKNVILFGLMVCLMLNVNAYVSVATCRDSLDPLDNPATEYRMTIDLTDPAYTTACFQIANNDITLDCQGHTITFSGIKHFVSAPWGYSGFTLKNCNVVNGTVEVLYANRTTIMNNNLYIRSYNWYALFIGVSSGSHATHKNILVYNNTISGYTYFSNLNYTHIFNNYFNGINYSANSRMLLIGNHEMKIYNNAFYNYNWEGTITYPYHNSFGMSGQTISDVQFYIVDLGNYWSNVEGTGFSDTCSGSGDVCDDDFLVWDGTGALDFYDYYPLTYDPTSGGGGGGGGNGTDCTTSDDCSEGYWCHDGGCVSNNQACFDSSDCSNPSTYCDNLTMGEGVSACWWEKQVGGECFADSWCTSGICGGDVTSAQACTSTIQCYGLGSGYECLNDGVCHLSGTCTLNDKACDDDTECIWSVADDTCVNGSGSGNTTCFCNEVSGECDQKITTFAWGANCLREAWCMDDTYSGLGYDLTCLGFDNATNESGLCSPDSWECNYGGGGCPAGESCNWTEGVGDHTCDSCSVTTCSSDSACCSGNCMNGRCYATNAECNVNLNGQYGVVGGTEVCPSDEWCHSYYSLTNWYPHSPNYKCYHFFDEVSPQAATCDYGYQCKTGRCSAGLCQSYNGSSGSTTIDAAELGAMTALQWADLNVWYMYGSQLITGATCTYSSNGFVDGTGSLDGSPYAYSTFVQIANVSGSKSVTFTCSKSGYSSLSKTIYFTVYQGTTVTSLVWVSRPVSMFVGSRSVISVRYKTSDGTGITGANCTLTIGGTSAPMDADASAGVYYSSYYGSYAQVTTYFVDCSKSTYQSQASDDFQLTVRASTTPTLPLASCRNLVKDGTETDIDCGGSCSACAANKICSVNADCLSVWCLEGKCGSPSCSDHIKNGFEVGVDCGGGCPACMCMRDSDCSTDGSQYCSGYSCVTKVCSTSADCPDLLWYSSSLGWYTRDRECKDGVCRFTSLNESSGGMSMSIFQKVPLIWNDSNRQVYLFNCEDPTNSLTVLTSLPTRKWYHLSDPTYYTPFAPVTTSAISINDGYVASNVVVLSKLCEIPTNSDNLSSLITFYATDTSQYQRVRSIYALAFRYAFRINQTQVGSDQVRLMSTKLAKCFYRQGSSNWSVINSASSKSILWNVNLSKSTGSYQVMCNNTFGEEARLIVGTGVRSILLLIWDGFVVALLATMYMTLIGSPFKWEAWFIIPIFLIIFTVLPAGILMVVAWSKRNSKGGEKWVD